MSNDDVSDQFTRGWISLGIGLLMLLVGLLDLLRFTAKGSMGAGFEAAFFLILGLFLLVRGAKLRPKS